MNINDAFPGKYLKAADLKGKEPTVTIDRVVMENIGDDPKLVVYFKKVEKGLVLNKTNASSIAELANHDETDKWPGTRIKLITAKVEYQGKRVPAIRVEDPASPPAPPPVTTIDDDDSMPF